MSYTFKKDGCCSRYDSFGTQKSFTLNNNSMPKYNDVSFEDGVDDIQSNRRPKIRTTLIED